MMPTAFRRQAVSSQFIPHGIVPEKSTFHPPLNQAIFRSVREPVEATGVSYSGTPPTDKLPPSIRFQPIRRRSLMTITAAHIPAIVALLAGILILIMPRFLNFIIAIYLILVGLQGLGFLRAFHM
jgi:Protein of unknown function (DUF3096)